MMSKVSFSKCCSLKHVTSIRKPHINLLVSPYATDLSSASTKKVTFREKFKETWNGPTFKYWFIGGTAFVSWMVYYGIRTYRKTRIDIQVLPSLPSHSIVKRTLDINNLFERHNAQSGLLNREKVKTLMVLGAAAAGKTVLVHDFAKMLQEKQNGFKYTKSSEI